MPNVKLTEAQKEEIGAYIAKSIKYRETYFEVLDHLISKFENADYEYDGKMLRWEIRIEFGSLEKIAAQERKFVMRKKWSTLKSLSAEMLNSFKFPNIFFNLIIFMICTIIYHTDLMSLSYFKWFYFGIMALLYFITSFWLIKDGGIRSTKKNKPLLKTEIVNWLVAFPICLLNLLFVTIFNKTEVFEIETQNITVLALFFFSCIYTLSFKKLYKENLKVIF